MPPQSYPPIPVSTNSHDRNNSLDGLRFFAFLAVFLYHTQYWATGSYGVTVFFVLSGFLIGRILLKQKQTGVPLKERLRTFYIRRALRIFPLYYLVLGTLWLRSRHHSFFMGDELAWESVYLTNVWRFFHSWVDLTAHFWTLAIEEQFYLLAPLIIFLVSTKQLMRGYALYTVINIVAQLCIVWTAINAKYYLLPFSHFCFLGLGVVVAMMDLGHTSRLFNQKTLARGGQVCLIAVVTFSLPYLDWCVVHQPGWYEWVVSLFSAWLILGLWQQRFTHVGRFLSCSPFVFLGKISYGLYVYHWPVLLFMPRYFHHRLPIAVVSFCLTVLIATLSWYVIESPILKAKRFFDYKKSP